MTIREVFVKHFSTEALKKIFFERIVFSSATGVDNLNQLNFRNQLLSQIEIASEKVIKGTYTFSKYKLKLVNKGRGKFPREISIPTVRDRIVLRALCNFLNEIYSETINFELPQSTIKKLKNEIEVSGHNAIIKLDVKSFYPSIKHGELISRLGKKIRDKKIKDIFISAITSPTVSVSGARDGDVDRGVPQGLAISNYLAAIYLSNIDQRLLADPRMKYHRYVDDVLILCDLDAAEGLSKEVISRFRQLGLSVYDPVTDPEKSKIGAISKGFDYLGYSFSEALITVRPSTTAKLKRSLVGIFTRYKYARNKNQEFLLWCLNLRITGCVYEGKRKGWLFFFSEIDDEPLLHQLDHYVKKIARRFGVLIESKKFVRAHKEITKNGKKTRYIPNFDIYEVGQMREVLVEVFRVSVDGMDSSEVEYQFKRRLRKEVKELQVDLAGLS